MCLWVSKHKNSVRSVFLTPSSPLSLSTACLQPSLSLFCFSSDKAGFLPFVSKVMLYYRSPLLGFSVQSSLLLVEKLWTTY